MLFFLRCVVRTVLAVFILPKNIILYLIGYRNRGKSEAVDALFTKGYHVYADRLPSCEILKLTETYQKMFEESNVETCGQSNGRIMMPHLNSDVICAYINEFRHVARDYFNHQSIEVELSMFQRSKVETNTENVPGGGYHVDDDKKNLKFFIYLTDVTEKNGPFVLSPNSHGLSWHKVIRWFGWEVTTNRKYFYLDDLPSGCNPPVKVTGSKGMVFCADTTIYHKADRVLEGERLVLVISFAERRFDPYKYLAPEKINY